MMFKLVAGATALAMTAGVATAQGFSGAELSAEVFNFSDNDDISQTTYRGSAEFGIAAGFGVAADLSYYDVGETDGVRNGTVHVLYDALQFATIGAFYARDSNDDFTGNTLGIEAQRSFGGFGVEAHAGHGDEDGSDYQLYGLDGTYDLSSAISLKGSAALVAGEDSDVSRLSIGGEYRFGVGPAVYAEVGRVNTEEDASGDDNGSTFIGFGARIAIGPNRGTTFDPRGPLEAITGF